MTGLSKQHFKAIAEILKRNANVPHRLVNINAVYELADYFGTENERFDKQKFIEACLK